MIPLSKLAAAADLSYVKESIVSDNELNAALYTVYAHPQEDKLYYIISFRGTDTLEDWVMNNLVLLKKKIANGEEQDNFFRSDTPRAHMGFYYAYLSLKHKLLETLDYRNNFYFTGHSMGGALATLAALEYKQKFPDCDIKIVTFGCPRIGNLAFSQQVAHTIGEENCFRVVKMFDPVPSTPVVGYTHTKGEVIRLGNWNPVLAHHMPHYYKLCRKLKHLL